VRFRLLPTDDRFFELFSDAADNVAECARHFRAVVAGEPGGLDAVIASERRGDEITREILRRLNTSFVTPFDREDIHALAEELDDVVDDMQAVAARVRLTVHGAALPELKEQADILVRMADETVSLMTRLPSMKRTDDHLKAIDQMESEGDTVYRHALARLFSGEYDALDVLRWKDIIEAMEAALNTLEDVSNVVESIVLKHA
jgi:predicted phosphate transport protein (TIGR00153 family)